MTKKANTMRKLLIICMLFFTITPSHSEIKDSCTHIYYVDMINATEEIKAYLQQHLYNKTFTLPSNATSNKIIEAKDNQHSEWCSSFRSYNQGKMPPLTNGNKKIQFALKEAQQKIIFTIQVFVLENKHWRRIANMGQFDLGSKHTSNAKLRETVMDYILNSAYKAYK